MGRLRDQRQENLERGAFAAPVYATVRRTLSSMREMTGPKSHMMPTQASRTMTAGALKTFAASSPRGPAGVIGRDRHSHLIGRA
jgi:hypothetical protein